MDKEYGSMRLLLISITHGRPDIRGERTPWRFGYFLEITAFPKQNETGNTREQEQRTGHPLRFLMTFAMLPYDFPVTKL